MEFSFTIRRMRARTSASIFGLPRLFGRERRRQNNRKPARCQATTVSGAPCRPEAAEQDPKYSILDSQPRVRLFSLEYAQLLTEGKDLEAEVVARTEECAEAGEAADKKWNHEFGFIA